VRSASGRLLGHVERAVGGAGGVRVTGWAMDAAAPRRPVALLARRGGAPCGVTVANHWRPDLDRAGLGDGGCGFVFDLPCAWPGVSLHRLSDDAPLPCASQD